MEYHSLMSPRSDATPGPSAAPELELDLRESAQRPRRAAPADPPESPLELAVDPRELVRERGRADDLALEATAPIATVPDIGSDARLLADYGDPPRHWLLSPIYAWRVLRRRRELKKALAGRREEAARASSEVDDALVAFAERSRSTAEQCAAYAEALEQLGRAEAVLRSRDQVLADEQDAHGARLAQVDARLTALEAELAQAQRDERATAAELGALQEALAREEVRLKRAEIELRAAQQRAAGAVSE